MGKTINGTVAINGYRVFVPIAEPHRPRILALDLRTGRPMWETVIDTQKNADVYGSPVVWNGNVYMGVSAEYGELNDPEVNVRGSVVALNAKTGKQRWKTFMVPEGFTGGSVWTTPAVDGVTGRLFVGTGNAYQAPAHENTDSVIALDARSGNIIDHFQATAGDVWNGTSNVAEGPDHDFGASPNLIQGPDGQQLIGIGQKSGTYWALDRDTLDPVWNTVTGPPAQVGGIVGSTAYDGSQIYGPDTPAGESWALGRDGSHKWVSSDGGPLHFNPTSVANGVVYTADMSGFLTARESRTGLVLNKIPLGAPSWGGVAVAGGTVFVAIGTQSSTGYIAAYRVRTGNEPNEPADHWDDEQPPDPNAESVEPHKHKKCKKPKGKKRTKRAMKKYRKCKKKLKKHEQKHPGRAPTTSTGRRRGGPRGRPHPLARLRPRRRPAEADQGEVGPLPVEAPGHDGAAVVRLRPVRGPTGPRHEPDRSGPAAQRWVHAVGRAGHAPRDRLDRAEPPGGAHPPRPLVRAPALDR